jgi:hypothetical protein
MKTLEKDELYQNVHGFLKTKGVELKPGSYSQKIQKSCALLSDAINVSQQGFARAKSEIDKKLGQIRQVIHEKTASRKASTPPRPGEAKQETPGNLARKTPRARKRNKKSGAA